MNRSFIKNTFFIIAGILIASLLVSGITNKIIYGNQGFFYNYIDIIFFVNLPVFLIASIMFLSESGLFNVFIYSTNKVRSVVSEKFKFELKETNNVEGKEVDAYLKEKYLYRRTTFHWTLPTFVGSSVIFAAIIVSVILFYGI